MDPPWHFRCEARGLYLSVSLCHGVDMNAKCAAAANRMLNEVEMTGAWLSTCFTTETMAYKLNIIYSGYTGAVAEWRYTALCCLQSSKANWTNYQVTCKTFGHQADITPASTIDCHRHTATLPLRSLPCCGEGSGFVIFEELRLYNLEQISRLFNLFSYLPLTWLVCFGLTIRFSAIHPNPK